MAGLLLTSCDDADSYESLEPRVSTRHHAGLATPVVHGGESVPIFLLAGQSNMVGNVDTPLFESLLTELGQGPDEDREARLIAALQYWYFEVDDGYASYGYNDEMAALEVAELIALRDEGLIGADFPAPLREILCSQGDTPIAPLTTNCGGPFGPELMLGHALRANGLMTTSLVKIAEGGTTLLVDWRSPSSGGEVGPQYVRLSDRIASLTEDPASVHPSCAEAECHWAAFIWFQGENDSFDEPNATSYQTNLENLLADVRSEVGSATLPVIVIQTGAWAQSLDYGPIVASAQQAIVDADEQARLVPTNDLSGFYHYDPAAQLIIGKRVADAVEDVLGCDGPECGTSDSGDPGTDSDSGNVDGPSSDGDSAESTDGSDETDDGPASGTSPGGSTSADGGTGDTAGTAGSAAGDADETPSGCGCRHRGGPVGTAWAWLGLVAFMRRRSRRRA